MVQSHGERPLLQEGVRKKTKFEEDIRIHTSSKSYLISSLYVIPLTCNF